METRQERGLVISKAATIVKTPVGWKVPSTTGKGSYIVNLGKEPFCSCPDFEERQQPCKHIYAVEFIHQRITKADGTTVETKTVRVTYGQNWHAYNEAQTHETERFVSLLRNLCDSVPQPEQSGAGRPRLPLSDVLFGVTLKAYTGMSGRRVMSDFRESEVKGLMTKAPSFTSTFRYLENPELTPIFKALIEESSKPLKAIESNFAVDSTGFSTTTYNRWFDHKWGKMRSEAKWLKTHLMCGVKTHIVTSVEVHDTETSDNLQLPKLLERTAQNFEIAEVSGDKAYSGRKNLRAVDAIGAVPYIPFMRNATGGTNRRQGKEFDPLWNYMHAYYNFNRAKFLEHYHKRSNVETAFSMIKMKFGASVRSKTPTAQINEVLAKVLCHNLCVLIQSWYELGIEAEFGTRLAVVPQSVANEG